MRLIDADKLEEHLNQLAFNYASDKELFMKIMYAASCIETEPTVEAEPVEYAHWIEINYGTIAQCSGCYDMFDVIDTDSIKIANKAFDNFCALYNYCPNCGRRIRKKDE